MPAHTFPAGWTPYSILPKEAQAHDAWFLTATIVMPPQWAQSILQAKL